LHQEAPAVDEDSNEKIVPAAGHASLIFGQLLIRLDALYIRQKANTRYNTTKFRPGKPGNL
jgi:hypothetical protein